MTDEAFPFEFTIPLQPDGSEFRFKIEALLPDGATGISEIGNLVKQ